MKKQEITVERKQEIDKLFYAETNDPESEEWRNYLIPSEQEYVNTLDDSYSKGFENLAKAIQEAVKRNETRYSDSISTIFPTETEIKDFIVTRNIGQIFTVSNGNLTKDYELLRGSEKEMEIATQIAEDFNITLEEGAEIFEEAANQNAVESEVGRKEDKNHQNIENKISLETEKEEVIDL